MPRRSFFVQIRVTPEEKATLKRLAEASGQDLSGYVLSRSLPSNRLRFEEIVRQLADEANARYVLADLNDFLAALAPVEFPDAVAAADLITLTRLLANYVAAMVEHAAVMKGVAPPAWTRLIDPLEQPHFSSPLRSHRLHLLRASPVAFKKRNIFVDATVGSRV